jgi:hypothetical protein
MSISYNHLLIYTNKLKIKTGICYLKLKFFLDFHNNFYDQMITYFGILGRLFWGIFLVIHGMKSVNPTCSQLESIVEVIGWISLFLSFYGTIEYCCQ